MQASTGFEDRADRPLPTPERLIGGILAAMALTLTGFFPSLWPRPLAERFFGVVRVQPTALRATRVPGSPDQVHLVATAHGAPPGAFDPRVGMPGGPLALQRPTPGQRLLGLDLRLTRGGIFSGLFSSPTRFRFEAAFRIDPDATLGFQLGSEDGPGLVYSLPLAGLAPDRIGWRESEAGPLLDVHAEVQGRRWSPPRVVPEAALDPDRGPSAAPGCVALALLSTSLDGAPGPAAELAVTVPAPAPPDQPLAFLTAAGPVVFLPLRSAPGEYLEEDLRGASNPGERLAEVLADWRR